jgi:hypothetical protein
MSLHFSFRKGGRLKTDIIPYDTKQGTKCSGTFSDVRERKSAIMSMMRWVAHAV